MKTKIIKNISYWTSVITIGIVLGLSLQFVKAWTEPTMTAPSGNVGAPINTSITSQIKDGPLQVNGFRNYSGSTILDGNVGIGTTTVPASAKLEVNGASRLTPGVQPYNCTSSVAGSMYFNSGSNNFMMCNGTSWATYNGFNCSSNGKQYSTYAKCWILSGTTCTGSSDPNTAHKNSYTQRYCCPAGWDNCGGGMPAGLDTPCSISAAPLCA